MYDFETTEQKESRLRAEDERKEQYYKAFRDEIMTRLHKDIKEKYAFDEGWIRNARASLVKAMDDFKSEEKDWHDDLVRTITAASNVASKRLTMQVDTELKEKIQEKINTLDSRYEDVQIFLDNVQGDTGFDIRADFEIFHSEVQTNIYRQKQIEARLSRIEADQKRILNLLVAKPIRIATNKDKKQPKKESAGDNEEEDEEIEELLNAEDDR